MTRRPWLKLEWVSVAGTGGVISFVPAALSFMAVAFGGVGKLWGTFAHGGKYRVETPNGVAGIRGTTVYADVASDEDSQFCLCDGGAEVAAGHPDDLGGHPVHSKWQHKGYRFVGPANAAKVESPVGGKVKHGGPPQ